MVIQERATLLTAESKPYNVNGNEGVSHKARFNVQGEIYSLKCTANDIQSLQQFVGQTGDLVFDLTSRREQIAVVFKSFE